MNALGAVGYAAELHSGQVDKADLPYITHCVRVMMRLPRDATDDERVAALLHDSLEDCGISVEDLLSCGVSKEAASLVEALTRGQYESYEAFISRISLSGRSAIRIKIADIEDNLCPRRMSLLLPADKERLIRKYANALDILAKAPLSTDDR